MNCPVHIKFFRSKRPVYLFVTFATENIKVRFFQTDENDEPIWEDWGRFSEVDVHHQYAIGNENRVDFLRPPF